MRINGGTAPPHYHNTNTTKPIQHRITRAFSSNFIFTVSAWSCADFQTHTNAWHRRVIFHGPNISYIKSIPALWFHLSATEWLALVIKWEGVVNQRMCGCVCMFDMHLTQCPCARVVFRQRFAGGSQDHVESLMIINSRADLRKFN